MALLRQARKSPLAVATIAVSLTIIVVGLVAVWPHGPGWVVFTLCCMVAGGLLSDRLSKRGRR